MKDRARRAGFGPHVIAVVWAVAFMLPFAFMVLSSLKGFDELFEQGKVFPDRAQWRNYVEIFRKLPFAAYFANTFAICIVATAGQLVASSMAGYAFARVPFRGRETLFLVVLATMMIPYQVTMIPLFLGFKALGLVNPSRRVLGLLPIVLPQLFATGFNLFLFRQFFRTIPYELDEAAFMDGASRWTIYWRIILPLSKPVLIVVGLFTFFWNWKDLMGPLIYLNDKANTTVALGLTYLKDPQHIDWHLIMAASAISLVPVVVLFFIGQRHLVKGIALTGLKG
jgi:multiple sugar transport system permease protein